jgi:hypothetical protein
MQITLHLMTFECSDRGEPVPCFSLRANLNEFVVDYGWSRRAVCCTREVDLQRTIRVPRVTEIKIRGAHIASLC